MLLKKHCNMEVAKYKRYLYQNIGVTNMQCQFQFKLDNYNIERLTSGFDCFYKLLLTKGVVLQSVRLS